MIEFQHVFKSYGRGRNILADISLRIEPGEFVFVSGPSGAGKSTLLKLVGGLEPPSRGSILVNGQRLDRLSARARPYLRRAVGVILQDTHLLYDRSAFANVLLPLAVLGLAPDAAASRARAALEKVGLLGREEANPVELSGGEQQRLAIARAIVNRPSVLVVDEPTANLDRDTARRIMAVFRDFNRVGVTLLIASHDEALMAEHAGRTLRVEPGRFGDWPGVQPGRALEPVTAALPPDRPVPAPAAPGRPVAAGAGYAGSPRPPAGRAEPTLGGLPAADRTGRLP